MMLQSITTSHFAITLRLMKIFYYHERRYQCYQRINMIISITFNARLSFYLCLSPPSLTLYVATNTRDIILESSLHPHLFTTICLIPCINAITRRCNHSEIEFYIELNRFGYRVIDIFIEYSLI